MGEDEDKQLPQPTEKDVAHSFVKGTIASIPVIGGIGSELFSLIITAPLEKRKNEWMNSVADKLVEMEKAIQGFKIESLQGNDLFISIIMHASNLAIKNHQEEKIEALRNAVLHSALATNLEENTQFIFLNYIDFLTPLHLKILKYFENPEKWLAEREITTNIIQASPSKFLELGIPELKNRRETYDLMVDDLHIKGLVRIDSQGLWTGMYRIGCTESRITNLGRSFIKYISPPISS